MHLVLHPAAEQELRDALARSEAEFGPQVARQLKRRLDKLGEALMHDPHLGTP
jgi:plasmid stabilization system protein ParE